MKKLLFQILLFCSILASCSTMSSSTVASDTDFSKYVYAAIGSDLDGGAVLYESQIKLQNSLVSCGYKIIGDTRIGTLNSEEQKKVFIVTMGMTSTELETVCVINLKDYMSGYILASCKGTYGLGWDMQDDQRHAIAKAIKQMEILIRK